MRNLFRNWAGHSYFTSLDACNKNVILCLTIIRRWSFSWSLHYWHASFLSFSLSRHWRWLLFAFITSSVVQVKSRMWTVTQDDDPCIIGQSMETKSSLEVVEHQITTLGHKQWVCVNLQQQLNVQYRWRHKTKQQLFVSLGGVCSTSLFYHGIGNVLPGRCYLKRKMISLTLCAV